MNDYHKTVVIINIGIFMLLYWRAGYRQRNPHLYLRLSSANYYIFKQMREIVVTQCLVTQFFMSSSCFLFILFSFFHARQAFVVYVQ